MNGPLTVGSLFSGIGGFDLGFERAGMSTAWFCEQDDYCRRVLNRHWPDVPVYPDVTQLRGSEVERVDVLAGGFPCQDLSLAGKGAGITGSRSGLWSEYARLIGELRPRYVVVENVTALLGRGFGTVLGDLAALGYDAEWDCIPASAVGAPHQRDRVWIVAYPGGTPGGLGEPGGGGQGWEPSDARQPALVRQEDRQGGAKGFAACGQVAADAGSTGLEGHGCPVGNEAQLTDVGGAGFSGGVATEDVADPEGVGQREPADETHTLPRGRNSRFEPSGGGWWAVEPGVGRVADGVPARVDRTKALGNALVPQIAEWIGRRIVSYEQSQPRQTAISGPSKEPS